MNIDRWAEIRKSEIDCFVQYYKEMNKKSQGNWPLFGEAGDYDEQEYSHEPSDLRN